MTRTATKLAAVLLLVAAAAGCDQLDGRNRTRKGKRLFREMQFVDSVVEYQTAIDKDKLDDPVVH